MKIMRFSQKNLLTVLCLFFALRLVSFAQHTIFSNFSGSTNAVSKVNNLSPPRYGLTKRGETLAFLPYTGFTIPLKNKITFLKPQTPVIVTGELDFAPFYYVETDLVQGFLKKENVYLINEEIFTTFIEMKKVILKKTFQNDGITYPIATQLPMIEKKGKKYKVRIVKDDSFDDIWIDSTFATEPLPISYNNLKSVTRFFLNKPYQWGNSEIGWDCSGLLVDFFSFFDIKLPRNSNQQIGYITQIDVSEKSIKQKELILKKSKPYMTLLYFPGHIMLYTGKKGKEFISFQALNRIGNKRFAKVNYFPLKKTGLLRRVTKIGFIEKNALQNLTLHFAQGKI